MAILGGVIGPDAALVPIFSNPSNKIVAANAFPSLLSMFSASFCALVRAQYERRKMEKKTRIA